jgi:ferrous iron transport protein B
MSCSARLPVYALMIAVLLPAGFSSWKKADVMLAMYLLGLFVAFGMAWLFRKKSSNCGGGCCRLANSKPKTRPPPGL